jgi:hypothetical protein
MQKRLQLNKQTVNNYQSNGVNEMMAAPKTKFLCKSWLNPKKCFEPVDPLKTKRDVTCKHEQSCFVICG